MTLRTKHGGPVFDGLWVNYKYGFLKDKGVESGGWVFEGFFYKNLALSGDYSFVAIEYVYTVDYCLAPINLVRWDSDAS